MYVLPFVTGKQPSLLRRLTNGIHASVAYIDQ
jgi:hypothetical protein